VGIRRARRLPVFYDMLVIRLAIVLARRLLRSWLLSRLAVILGGGLLRSWLLSPLADILGTDLRRSWLLSPLAVVLGRVLRSRLLTHPGRVLIAARPARIVSASASGGGYFAAPRVPGRCRLLRLACRERHGYGASDRPDRLVAGADRRHGDRAAAYVDRHGHERRGGTAERTPRHRGATCVAARSENRADNRTLKRESRPPREPRSQPGPPAAYRVTVGAAARAIVEVPTERRAPERRAAKRRELFADLRARGFAGVTRCTE
jgi:hypothetical protein